MRNKLDPSQRRPDGTLAPKLIDAATILIVRRDMKSPSVLMGHRSAAHKFMPNTFVFPGGRVDPNDHTPPTAGDLAEATLHRLTRRRRVSKRKARALALAAIRETFEETGLIVGRKHKGAIDPASVAEDWQEFFAAGYAPAIDALDYIYRAVTPPDNFRRFDARFFFVDAEHAFGEIGGSGELVDLQWIPIDDAAVMDNTPSPTRGALAVAKQLVLDEASMPQAAETPVPSLVVRYGVEGTEYD